MEGFFSNKEVTQENKNKSVLPKCGACKLHKDCNSPKMKVRGNGIQPIMIIGSFPSERADSLGVPIVDSYLRMTLKVAGINLKDCHLTNAVACYGEDVDNKNGGFCSPKLLTEIRNVKPKLIITLGNVATYSVIGDRLKKGVSLFQTRGYVIPDQKLKCWVAPLQDPINGKADDVFKLFFEKELKQAVSYVNKPFPVTKESDFNIECLKGEKDIIRALKRIDLKTDKPIAIDYETSGIKPHREGHYIKTCSLSVDSKSALSFVVTDKIKPYLNKILASNLKKIAANMKFEENWSRFVLDQPVKNWYFDTMLAAHILDNRPRITGVKFQTYLYFGVEDYSRHIDFGEDLKANDFNAIEKIDLDELLWYNALDTIYEYKLYEVQKPQLKKRALNKAYNLFHRSSEAFCDIEENGICIDMDYLENALIETKRTVEKDAAKFLKTKIGRTWKKHYGNELNLDAGDQLSDVLFNILKFKSIKKTKKEEKDSSDISVLEKLNEEDLLPLIMYKKVTMARGFLKQIEVEQVGGILRSSFNLNIPVSYRSSSRDPNFQNFPIRDKVQREIVRKCFVPDTGNQILELDFKGAEITAACCYHKDPKMESYLLDSTLDMHRDMAMECYMLDQDQVSKETRYAGKSGFVFPEFYGSWFKSVGKSLWEYIDDMHLETNDGVCLKEHLKSKGIINQSQFTDHIEDVEDEFWNVRFKVYTKWKKKWEASYMKKGFIRSLSGFEFINPMTRNQIINYGIQGFSFHLLLWTMVALNNYFKRKGLTSRIIGQIHDSIVIDLVPEEKELVVNAVKHIIENQLPKKYKGLYLPMFIEAEITDIDGSWDQKEEIEI